MEGLRKGVRCLIRKQLRELAAAAWPPMGAGPELAAAAEAAAEALEAELHRASPPEGYIQAHYELAAKLEAPLGGPAGDFPDGQAGLAVLRGELTAAEAAAAEPPRKGGAVDPRRVYTRLFIRVLMESHPKYADRAAAAAAGASLERGCYNTAIERGARERQISASWRRREFVEYYSEICGALVMHLDAASQSCAAYGAGLLCDLAEGRVDPEELGAWPAGRLCPGALAAARAEIETRQAQKVEEKASNLYTCPHCKVARCTYVSVQLRSSDEPATMVCSCLACGKGFRVG